MRGLTYLTLLAAILGTTTPTDAAGQIYIGLGSGLSEKAKVALPLARCIWAKRYNDALAFSDRVDEGMKLGAIRQTLSDLASSCNESVKRQTGDLFYALLGIRNEQVAMCLRTHSPKPFAHFVKQMRKAKHRLDRRTFLENGFPTELSTAIAACDPSLQKSYSISERGGFGADVFGWPYD